MEGKGSIGNKRTRYTCMQPCTPKRRVYVEKNRVTDMRTHLQTHPHIEHETKQVCPTDRNEWGSKQKGKGTIGKTNRSTPIQTP